MSFIDSIYEKAKADVKTIAIPEYDNDYMMKAAVKAHHDGIANIPPGGPRRRGTGAGGRAGPGHRRHPHC